MYARNQGGANTWGEVVKLIASDAGDNGAFGLSVAPSGDTLMVGGTSGGVYVFERDEGGASAWGETQKLLPSDEGLGGFSGFSVALEGNRAVIGS